MIHIPTLAAVCGDPFKIDAHLLWVFDLHGLGHTTKGSVAANAHSYVFRIPGLAIKEVYHYASPFTNLQAGYLAAREAIDRAATLSEYYTIISEGVDVVEYRRAYPIAVQASEVLPGKDSHRASEGSGSRRLSIRAPDADREPKRD